MQAGSVSLWQGSHTCPAAPRRGHPHTKNTQGCRRTQVPKGTGTDPAAHTATPRVLLGAITARQPFPWPKTEPASQGCRYLISWVCHSVPAAPPGPGERLPASGSPGEEAEQAAEFLPARAGTSGLSALHRFSQAQKG